MNTDRNAIFYRYRNALVECSDDGSSIPEPGAVRLALRLAIDDSYEAASVIANELAAIVAAQEKALQAALDQVDQLRQQRNDQPDQRVNEHLQAQISRLNDWLQVHEPGLYISPGDTADAVLAALGIRDRRIAELNVDLEKLQTDVDTEIAELQESLSAAQDAFARLPQTDSQASHVNGAEPPANPTTAPDWNRDHPAWNGMSDEHLEVLLDLMTGKITFRQASKQFRLNLVQRVLRHLADENGKVAAPQFDRLRPHWMPTAGAVVALVESHKWHDLLTLALEPTPA